MASTLKSIKATPKGKTWKVRDQYNLVWADRFPTKEKAEAWIKKHKGKTPYLNMSGKVDWYDKG